MFYNTKTIVDWLIVIKDQDDYITLLNRRPQPTRNIFHIEIIQYFKFIQIVPNIVANIVNGDVTKAQYSKAVMSIDVL